MTKDELIALVKEGKAHIELAFTINRYAITEAAVDAQGEPIEYPAIFMSVSNTDGSVYDDEAYFTDDIDDDMLTEEEAETLRQAIEQAAIQP
jgi:hypothetical protein